MSNVGRWPIWKGREISRRDSLLACITIVILAFVLVGLLTACAPKKETAPAPSPGTNEVWIIGWNYVPQTINVAAGTTVTWTNTHREFHTVTSDDGLFDSPLGFGESFSYTFTSPGTFTYHDKATDPPVLGKVVVE